MRLHCPCHNVCLSCCICAQALVPSSAANTYDSLPWEHVHVANFFPLLFHALGLGQHFQAYPSKYRYISEVLHNRNMGQQYPRQEKVTVDMEMSEETHTDDYVMCVDFGEDVAPTTCNDSASVEEMERAEGMCENVRKMCRKFDRSMALSMHWIMRDSHLKTCIYGDYAPPQKTYHCKYF